MESHRRFSMFYPDESVHEQVEGKRGKFQDLRQMVGLGMKRSQIDDILKLFDWSEREEQRLANLTWTSGFPESLANRKCKHLSHLFEAVHAVAICPGSNVTQNPTSEWELKFCGN